MRKEDFAGILLGDVRDRDGDHAVPGGDRVGFGAVRCDRELGHFLGRGWIARIQNVDRPVLAIHDEQPPRIGIVSDNFRGERRELAVREAPDGDKPYRVAGCRSRGGRLVIDDDGF